MTAETTSPQAGSPPAETRIDRLSPDALVASFSQSHLLKWFLAALAFAETLARSFAPSSPIMKPALPLFSMQ